MLGVTGSVVLFLLYSFTLSPCIDDQQSNNVIQVHQQDANTYRDNFNRVFPNKTKGFDISLGQWQAINQVVRDLNYDTDKISGFRLYHGLKKVSASATKVTTVYALSSSKREPEMGSANMSAMVTTADNVDSKYQDPCPPFCD